MRFWAKALNLARVFRDDPEMSSLACGTCMVKRWPLHTTLRRAVTMDINIKQQQCMRRSRPTMLFVIILAKILEWPGLVYNTVTLAILAHYRLADWLTAH